MSGRPATPGALDVDVIRAEFPILDQVVHGKSLVYLDSAATTQKPRAVIDAIARYYQRDNANVHRGVHTLSQRATEAYEGARAVVQRFLGAPEARQIVFTRGTTEAINLVAASWGRSSLGPGDEIAITEMEHHSNIVPWQLVAEQTGARLRSIPIDEHGQLDMAAYAEVVGPRTRLVAATHVSNALGTVNPVARIVELAHAHGALVLIDGAQAVPHQRVDVSELGCDFYACSAHKAYGPTGIGALYARGDLLDRMPPYQGGGEMIREVRIERSTWAPPPAKFEAGTPNIAGAVGMAAAFETLERWGLDAVASHEHTLLAYGTERLAAVPGLRLIGTAPDKAAVLSFVLDGVHPHDVGTILDHAGVAVRTGHHCAQPVMHHFGIAATTRASLGVYNSRADIDRLVVGLERVVELFGR